MKVTAIMNLKGGVAKTITAVNMAAILAEKHEKAVLLIDADHQGNSSSFFPIEESDLTLNDLLTERQVRGWEDYIQCGDLEGLDIIPSDMRLAELDLTRGVSEQEQSRRIFRLRDVLDRIADANVYDHVIIDMPPSFSTAAQAALIAASEVIVPMKLDAFSLKGMQEMGRQIRSMKQLNPDLNFLGILVTMRRSKTRLETAVDVLRSAGFPVFEQTIRMTDGLVDDSTYAHESLLSFSPRCGAARDYIRFVEEYLKRSGENG